MKFTTLIAILSICFANPSYAEIIKTSDFQVIHNLIYNTADQNTLVLFDVDEVIFYPSDQVFHPHHSESLDHLAADQLNRISHEKREYLRSIAFLTRHHQLVDARIIATLDLLQKNKIRTAALTHCGTGPQGKIAKLEDWRVEVLNGLGINFATLNNLEDHVFPEITAVYGKPLIKSGVIFTAHADKAVVLQAVLHQSKIYPSKIIFIDDKLRNLKTVENMAQENKIEFIGIQYTSVKDAKVEPLNIERARLQFKVLESNRIWLSDKEADGLLSLAASPH